MKKPVKLQEAITQKSWPITGVAFIIEAAKDQGFNNFRILQIFLVDGQIVHVEKTQPYGSFEAWTDKLENMVDKAGWNLNSRFRDGIFSTLGNDDRDQLVNRLKKTDLETLKKIAPALGLDLDPQQGSA